MSLQKSHKTQLSLTSGLVAGVLLAVLFAVAWLIARQNVLYEKEVVLESTLKLLGQQTDTAIDVDEARGSYPMVSISVYGPSGNLSRHEGTLTLPRSIGVSTVGDVVMSGRRIRSQTVVVGMTWDDGQRFMNQLAVFLAMLWLPLTVLIGAVTWLTARSVFRPLDKMADQAASIHGANMSDRLATQDRAEFGRFAEQLNAMLDRIQAAFDREEQFASDAAHELRTPLAIIRTQAETTLLNPRKPEEYVTSLDAIVGEIERLTRIIEMLMMSSKSSVEISTPLDISLDTINIVERWRPRAYREGVTIECRTEPAQAKITPEELKVILDNLIDNALRFSPRDTSIEVEVLAIGGRAELRVRDHGPGVPEDLGDKIFERFVRGDDHRNRASGGAGIGLSVCKRIIESRGGSISLEREEGYGAVFVCLFEPV